MRFAFALGVSALLAISSAFGAEPTCALLTAEQTPRTILLETKLLAVPGAKWVERADLDKVLKEQKLQAAFGAQGVGNRVQLGKLLKADVLVMVREVKGGDEPALEVVVSETAGGLRLLVRAVPLTRDAEADATALVAAARAGLARYGEAVRAVVAVPPFVSQDLGFAHEHLRGGLSKLAEAEAFDRKGFVAVELAEAEAVARELALAGAKVDRPLPVYLVGEYRHDGVGADRTVTLKLRAEQGGKPVGKPVEQKVKAADGPAAVRAWSAAALDALAKDDKPRPPGAPKAEAKVLAERAAVFRRLGNWAESLALVEASLLLDPDQTELHAVAVKVLTPLTSAAFMRAVADAPGEAAVARRLYVRGLGHLEEFVARGGDLSKYTAVGGQTLAGAFRQGVFWLIDGHPWAGDAKAEMQAIRDEDREAALRIIPRLAGRGQNFPEREFVNWAVAGLPRGAALARLERIALDLQALPNARARTVVLLRGHMVDAPEFAALLGRLATAKSEHLRAAGAELKEQLDIARKTAPPKFASDPKGLGPNPPGPGAIKFTPIALTFDGRDPTRNPPRGVAGLLAVGKDRDLVWTGDGLYLLGERGQLRYLWRSPGANDWASGGFTSIRFDGRFVWAGFALQKKPAVLLVIDPEKETVWDLSRAEGLPQAPAEDLARGPGGATLLAAPLEPGRACVAGAILGRAWVAVGRFDPATGKATFKVIHEAREASDRTDKQQWTRTATAFVPFYAFAVEKAGPDGKFERRVLVGRGGENYTTTEYPLVIDPDRGTVDVFKGRVWNGPGHGNSAVTGGAVHFLEYYPNPESPNHPLARVVRLGLPGPGKEIVVAPLPPSVGQMSRVAVLGGTLHITLEQHEVDFAKGGAPVRTCQWWAADADGKNVRRIATGLPPIAGVWQSARHGPVALVEAGPGKPAVLNAVEVADPAAKK